MINTRYYSGPSKCKFSGGSLDNAEVIISFESLPIPGLFFHSEHEAKDKKMPMTLVLSESGFFQLKEMVDGDLYRYYKSRQANKNHLDWLEDISSQIEIKFSKSAKILEVGGGEGMLLQHLHKKGFNELYNVDPSHENGETPCFKAINGLFPEALNGDLYKGYFTCIIGQHFLEHVLDPLSVLENASSLLSDDGEIWIEVPDIESSALESYYQIGVIYPLHLSYFTRETLVAMGEKAGLFLDSLEVIDHYGNSLWAKFSKINYNKSSHIEVVDNKIIVDTIRRYFEDHKIFASEVPKNIICWGAAERAHTTYAILSTYGINAISIFDSNPEIEGMYISGIGLPIQGPASFPENPDHLLILSPPNHKSIVDGIRHLLSKETIIHIPLVGHFTFKQYESKFY